MDDAVDADVAHEKDDAASSGEVVDDAVVEQAKALLGEIELDLAAIERALTHLESGTYGTCAICNEAIEPDRLAADPAASRCASHEGSAS